jgi:4-hydroxy-3-methylbut-2-enyl diphosphate reductase
MSRLTVRVSESAGFCPGVERALQLTLDAVSEAKKPINTLGPLIHNPSVIADLRAKGVGVVGEPAETQTGTMILRSHGVPKAVRQQLEESALNVVDATCPFVTSAQEKAARLSEESYFVIVLGDRDHPEVLALRSYAGERSLVVESAAELPPTLPSAKIGVVVQTTQSKERLCELVARLAPEVRQLLVHNTICNATELRQSAALAMASDVDAVVVVGGKESGNTRRLAELCTQRQTKTYHVESAEELLPTWFKGAKVVGVTAGASTPPEQIDAVVAAIEEMES